MVSAVISVDPGKLHSCPFIESRVVLMSTLSSLVAMQVFKTMCVATSDDKVCIMTILIRQYHKCCQATSWSCWHGMEHGALKASKISWDLVSYFVSRHVIDTRNILSLITIDTCEETCITFQSALFLPITQHHDHISGLVQDCSNSSALAMELLLFSAKPLTHGPNIYIYIYKE